jgi:hypothetical protein
MLALRGRHITQDTVGAAHEILACRIHSAVLLHGVADGLTALGAQTFHVFIEANQPLPILGRQGIEMVQTIDQPLLLLRRQTIEARLAAQRVFLAGRGFTLMVLQPIAQVRTAPVGRRRIVGSALARISGAWPIRCRRAGRNGRRRETIRGNRTAICGITGCRCAIGWTWSLRGSIMWRRCVRSRHVRGGSMRSAAMTAVLCECGRKHDNAESTENKHPHN